MTNSSALSIIGSAPCTDTAPNSTLMHLRMVKKFNIIIDIDCFTIDKR